jgi:hypothetical protein
MRAALADDGVSQIATELTVPHRAEVETIVAEIADFPVPDRAREQIPVGVDEARR